MRDIISRMEPFTEALDALGDPNPVRQDVWDVQDFHGKSKSQFSKPLKFLHRFHLRGTQ